MCSAGDRVAHHTRVCTVLVGLRLWGAGGGKARRKGARGKRGKEEAFAREGKTQDTHLVLLRVQR